MKRKILIITALAVSFAAFGQEKVNLSLDQAQAFAVDHNRTLKNAELDVKKAEASRWKAIAAMLPQINASADYSNMFGYKMDLGQMQISLPAYSTFGVQTGIGLNGALLVSAQVADISKKMSDITLFKTEKEIKDQVKTLYYSALVTEKTLELLNRNLESMEKLYEISQRSVDAGVSEQTSADQLKVQVSSMQNSIKSTERAIEMIYNSIRLQLCIDENTEIVLTQGLDDLMTLDKAVELMNEEFNINNNYDYQILKKSTDLTKKQIALTDWSNGPTLSVYHQYSAKHYFSDEMTMNMTPPNMLGMQLSIPLFTSGKTVAAHKEAVLNYKKQLNTVEDTELALKVQHSQLVFNLKSALEKYDNQKESVDVAQRVFDNISKKYEYGVASALEVTNAGTSLISAQSGYVQSLLDIVNAQISLEQLLNK